MTVLFDHGTPLPLRTFLKDHTVKDAKSQGWDTLGNRDLLDVAEASGFDVLLTTDKNIRYQQNLTDRKLASWLSATRNGLSCVSIPISSSQV